MSEAEPKNLPLPWCRLYAQEFLVDEKFFLIADETGEPVLLIRGLYIMLMCLAAKTRERDGKITVSEDIPMKPAQILRYLDLPAERAEPILQQMEELKMISRPDGKPWAVVNFADRNPPSDGKGAWYTQKWRNRKKKEEAEPPSQPPQPSAKDKKGAKAKGPSQGDDTPADRLRQAFTNAAGFFPPADPVQTQYGWDEPIEGWLLLANGDEALVEDWIRRAVQKQRINNSIFTKPANIDTTVRMIAGQVELKKLWRQAKKLMTRHGAHNQPKLDGQLAEVIEAAGGWVLLCKSDERIAQKKFSEAFDKVSHDRSNKEANR